MIRTVQTGFKLGHRGTHTFWRWVGCKRWVYNQYVAAQSEWWFAGLKLIPVEGMALRYQVWKETNEWLQNVPEKVLKESFFDAVQAFSNFRAGAGFPNFKKRQENFGTITLPCYNGHNEAGEWVELVKIRGKKVTLPKMKQKITLFEAITHGRVNSKMDEKAARLNSRPLYCTLSIAGKQRTVSFTHEVLEPYERAKVGYSTGMDVGITPLMHSDQRVELPWDEINELMDTVDDLSSKRDKKHYKSNRYNRINLQIITINQRIHNIVRDHIYKECARLTKHFRFLDVEGLSPLNLGKTHTLARRLRLCQLGKIFETLGWMGEQNLCTILHHNRYLPSSKRCSDCGYVYKQLPRDAKKWECPVCKVIHDREENARRNLLIEGDKVRLKTPASGLEVVTRGAHWPSIIPKGLVPLDGRDRYEFMEVETIGQKSRGWLFRYRKPEATSRDLFETLRLNCDQSLTKEFQPLNQCPRTFTGAMI